MTSAIYFAIIFAVFSIAAGEVIHHYGKILLAHALGADSGTKEAIGMLLKIGWYMVAVGLLLWNLGIEDAKYTNTPIQVQLSLRLGVAIFVQGFLHGFNILALSLFHRKNVG